MSQNNANDMFTQIMRDDHFHNIAQFTTTSTMIQQAFQIILHYQHITHNPLFTLPFITLLFSSLELINVDKSTHHQVPLLSNTYHMEIHTFPTLNKDLEIHLLQLINN